MLSRLSKTLGRTELLAVIAAAGRIKHSAMHSSTTSRAYTSVTRQAPNFDWVDTLRDKELFKQQCFIGGEWVDAGDGETLDVRT